MGGHSGQAFIWAAGSGQRGGAVEPELEVEVEVARSPFELWPPALLTGKPCRTAELQPDPLRALHLRNRGRGLGLEPSFNLRRL